jgi:hypothetical protein
MVAKRLAHKCYINVYSQRSAQWLKGIILSPNQSSIDACNLDVVSLFFYFWRSVPAAS